MVKGRKPLKGEACCPGNRRRSETGHGAVARLFALLGILLVVLSAGCGSVGLTVTTVGAPASSATAAPSPGAEATSFTGTAAADDKATVSVVYGASLLQVMEEKIGPAFAKASGNGYQGEGKGAVALANLILDRQRDPDVFITPDAEVNSRLMGDKNGNLVRWYISFAGTELVMGYNPKSRFAADLERARNGELPWYEVVQTPGLRIGRPDPELAPLGYRVLFAFSLAEKKYGLTGFRKAVLGDDANPSQVFPAEELTARLETGQFDVVFFYRTNATPHSIPYIALPPEVNQSDPSLALLYATQTYTSPKKGTVSRGSPIIYTATVLEGAPHPAGGLEFVEFLLSAEGQKLLLEFGATPVGVLSGGEAVAIPPGLRTRVEGALPDS
jgi:molybdate/tungstate transport system substrate-binding protein